MGSQTCGQSRPWRSHRPFCGWPSRWPRPGSRPGVRAGRWPRPATRATAPPPKVRRAAVGSSGGRRSSQPPTRHAGRGRSGGGSTPRPEMKSRIVLVCGRADPRAAEKRHDPPKRVRGPQGAAALTCTLGETLRRMSARSSWWLRPGAEPVDVLSESRRASKGGWLADSLVVGQVGVLEVAQGESARQRGRPRPRRRCRPGRRRRDRIGERRSGSPCRARARRPPAPGPPRRPWSPSGGSRAGSR